MHILFILANILLLIITIVATVFIYSILLKQAWYSLTKGDLSVPYRPTDTKTIDKMITRSGLKKGEKAIDLGAGTGNITLRAAQKTGAYVVGVEFNWGIWIISKIAQQLFPTPTAKLLYGDLTKISLAEYDVVFLFLSNPFLSTYVTPKLEKELKKGARVVSYVFGITSPLFSVQELPTGHQGLWSKMFLYIKR